MHATRRRLEGELTPDVLVDEVTDDIDGRVRTGWKPDTWRQLLVRGALAVPERVLGLQKGVALRLLQLPKLVLQALVWRPSHAGYRGQAALEGGQKHESLLGMALFPCNGLNRRAA